MNWLKMKTCWWLLLVLCLGLISCEEAPKEASKEKESKSSQSENNQKKSFTLDDLNQLVDGEKTDKYLWDISFGLDGIRVVKRLDRLGFDMVSYSNSYDKATFTKNNGHVYFGGIIWHFFEVFFRDNQFIRIKFYNEYKDKKMAIDEGNKIYNVLSKRYKMIKVEPKEGNVFLCSFGSSKVYDALVVFYVNRYESDGHVYYGNHLIYSDSNHSNNSLANILKEQVMGIQSK